MLVSTLRQWTYPKVLRIPNPAAELSIALTSLVHLLAAPSTPAACDNHEPQGTDHVDARALAQLGTHLWRLKTKLIDPLTSDPRPEFGRAYRHFDAAWDVLSEAGIEVIDPDRPSV